MRLEEILEEHGREALGISANRQAFEVRGDTGDLLLSFRPPLVLRIRPGHRGVDDYLEDELDDLGLELILLIQAGAVAMGLWEHGELLAHKAFKKYVVRGKGKAQPTHLGSKGKSRYGSRLRLQNWKSQIAEIKDRARAWADAQGGFDEVYVSCPVRLWPELFSSEPLPPFDQREGITTIPMDVAIPCHEELMRVRRSMEQGRLELW